MPKHANFTLPLQTLKRALLWFAIITPMAAIVGSACALFLWALERATDLRFQHTWLLWLLPVAGLLVGYLYHWLGKNSERGNNLIIEQIHQPNGAIPKRMAPLVLLTTVITHLFGGSAGREGTAVQIGGSISNAFAKSLKLNTKDLRIMLMAGVAAGFGAVFGTPLAGAIFALEVPTIGQIRYNALLPCLLASLISDWTCHAWGIHHTPYHVAYMAQAIIPSQTFNLNWLLIAKVALASLAFGLTARLFSSLSHTFSSLFKKLCPYPPLRPALGAIILIALVYILGTREYLGLGVSSPNPSDISLTSLFSLQNTHPWAWLWKLLFTTITLSAGFKGGEVTPLFFIGAALGSTLATLLGAPPDLFICLGFIAIFSGATNTPIASTIMGIELFGAANSIYLAAACFIAYQCSGHTSIYNTQHLATPKKKSPTIPPNTPLHKIPHP